MTTTPATTEKTREDAKALAALLAHCEELHGLGTGAGRPEFYARVCAALDANTNKEA